MTAFAIGDRVAFRFGCTAERLTGSIVGLAADRAGKPAALIQVDGFPSWRHLEPLIGIEHVQPGVTVLDRVGQLLRRHRVIRGAAVEWKEPAGEGEGIASERLDGPSPHWWVETADGGIQLVPESALRVRAGVPHA